MNSSMKVLFKPFMYVFYRAYLWQQRRQSRDSFAANVALAYVSLLLSFWTIAIFAAVDDIYGLPVSFSGTHGNMVFAIICGILFYFIPYFIFVRGEKYKKIISKFSKVHETKAQSRAREILIFFSYIIAFLLALYFAVLNQQLK